MRVYLVATLIVLAALGAAYAAFVVHVDDRGFIVEIGDHIYDPAGYVNQAVNRMLRDCSEVEHVSSSSKEWEAVTAYLRTTGSEPRLVLLMKTQSWLIAESEFSNLEPGVILLRAQDSGYKMESAWGGTNVPFKTPPAIREYFSSKVPAVPAPLVQCYEPIIPPFVW